MLDPGNRTQNPRGSHWDLGVAPQTPVLALETTAAESQKEQHPGQNRTALQADINDGVHVGHCRQHGRAHLPVATDSYKSYIIGDVKFCVKDMILIIREQRQL